MHLLRDFNKKYLGHEDSDPNATLLGKSFYDNYLSLAAVGNDTTYKGKPPPRLPTPHDLHSLFGRPSKNHSFLQDACFETSYVIVLKAGFFEPADILALHESHPLLSHLLCTCVHLRNYDFLWLRQYNQAWAKQSSLDDNKAYTFLACLLHYNLSVALTIWFLRNNYTGEYRDIPLIVAFLRLHGIAEDIISSYNRVMTVGCLNHFNASTTWDSAPCTGGAATTPPFVPRSTRSWRP
jgi:hypothetical protein